MSDLVETYRTACKARDAKLESVITACQHVILLSDLLRARPQEIQIVGIPQQVGISSAKVNFNGSNWPTASQINNALAEYHQALGAVRVAWLNVQVHGQEQGLAAPPSDPWGAMRKEVIHRASRPPR